MDEMLYWDNAATTWPKPECVYKFMDSFYRSGGFNAGRGSHAGAVGAGALIADTREKIKRLLHAENKLCVFTPSATVALNMLLQGFVRLGARRVYLSPFEHNAVTRVLKGMESYAAGLEVQLLSVDKETLSYDLAAIKSQFETAKPDLVVVSQVSNVCGLVAPVWRIFALAKEYGAATVCDLAQSAGLIDEHYGSEVVDAAVFAGHKTLYGPTGTGGFIIKPELTLPPVLFGGTGTESANQDMPQEGEQRYEPGTLNIAGIAGLNAALRFIEDTSVLRLRGHEGEVRRKLLELLREFSFVHIVGDAEGAEYTGIVSCVFDGLSSLEAGQVLSRLGVAVRAGLQCAPLAHKFLGTYPGGTVRFSCSYFSKLEDLNRLKTMVNSLYMLT